MNEIDIKIEEYSSSRKLVRGFAEKYIRIIVTAIALIIGVYLNFEITELVFFVYLIWIILTPTPSRNLAMIAILLLAMTPVFMIMKRDSWAETFAIYAYYFLILTVGTAILEYRKVSQSEDKADNAE